MICAVVLLFGTGGHVQHAMTYPWLAVVPGFLAALWVSSPEARRAALRARGRRPRSASGSPTWSPGSVKLRCLAHRGRAVHGLGVVGVSLYWLGDIACLWAALKIYNAELSTPALILAYATGYVATRRSLPAGGAGAGRGADDVRARLGRRRRSRRRCSASSPTALFNFWLPVIPALAALPAVRRMRAGLPPRREGLRKLKVLRTFSGVVGSAFS